MLKGNRDLILTSLRLLDQSVEEPADLVVIGGAALALWQADALLTKDVDLMQRPKEVVLVAAARLRGQPGFLPLDVATVATPPDDYESRLQCHPIEGLKHLRVWLPEAHDWAWMKLARGSEHDMQGIEALHVVSPLSLDTLLARLPEVLRNWHGPANRLRLNVLDLVARLWGEAQADDVERAWEAGQGP